MKILLLFTISIIALLAFASSPSLAESQAEKQCLPFSSITALHFEPGMTTTRRRTANQPRMSCVGSCPSDAIVSSAQCQQKGLSDNGLPAWKCVGSFVNTPGDNHQYRLGNVKVACEGCNKQGDTDVVTGSCTLKYSVESRMRRRGNSVGIHSSSYESHYNHHTNSLSVFDLFVIMFVVFGTCYCCIAMNRERRRRYETNDNKTLHELEKNGSTSTSPNGTVHHHHYDGGYGGGYFGGGGFWNGMFLGSLMSGGGYGGGYHNSTTIINNGYGDDGGSSYGGGGSDWGSGGGFGDTSSD